MIDWLLDIEMNGWLSLMLYWIPLMFTTVGYIKRTIYNYQFDIKHRANKNYYPTDSIGTIVVRLIITVTPIANIWTAIFVFFPEFFSSLWEAIGKFLETPLVSQLQEKID